MLNKQKQASFNLACFLMFKDLEAGEPKKQRDGSFASKWGFDEEYCLYYN